MPISISQKIKQRIADCNQFNADHYRPFIIDGKILGAVNTKNCLMLKSFPDVFIIKSNSVMMHPDLKDYPARTSAMAEILGQLKTDGLVNGWRDELYPVTANFTSEPVMAMERAAVPLFGFCGFGVHLNGFIETPDGYSMWVAKRSMNKPTGPGKLDQMVAGGQPIGLSLFENMTKESMEEASVPKHLSFRAQSIGALSYIGERQGGLRNDVLYIYDLLLPKDFTPINSDGEVEEFYLWPIHQVLDIVLNSQRFKFNTSLVIIDFCIRHGLIYSDLPDYNEIINSLHGASIATQFSSFT